jgi:alkylation response protein AidB-like acyl-CoA dehydrogenase
VHGYDAHYAALGADLDREMVATLVEEAGRFASRELWPVNAAGDREAVRLEGGTVRTAPGFREAYQKFVEAGWPTLTQPEAYGGQGLPASLGMTLHEFWQACNQAWSLYTVLGEGACATLRVYGDEQQKSRFLPKLVSGEWTGTMCLTEAHAGSDLGLLRTRAERDAEGRYRIHGSKIFISSGDHDLADNIVHLVLARLPDAPAGSAGISLFIVPKRRVDAEGNAGEPNGVQCGAVEHKMGLRGSATCVMNFDGAEAELLGPPNRGLVAMFTFINKSRQGVAVQAQAQAEGSYQYALGYARERLQGKGADGATAPIIAHPDVRRMLLTQRVFSEGGRALNHYCGKFLDIALAGGDEAAAADRLLSLLTPLAKACCSEWGCEAADLGVQILGGHGYLQDHPQEQRYRDVRIARIYEGTNGIQAQDFLHRKVLADGGNTLQRMMGLMREDIAASGEALQPLAGRLAVELERWQQLTEKMSAARDSGNADWLAFDYMMFSGYLLLAHQWLKIANAAQTALPTSTRAGYLQEKLEVARFCFDFILPRCRSHEAVIENGARDYRVFAETAS